MASGGWKSIMSVGEAIAALQERFGAQILEAQIEEVKDPFVRVGREDLVEVMTFCRDAEALQFDLLHCLSAVDYPKEDKVQLVYNL